MSSPKDDLKVMHSAYELVCHIYTTQELLDLEFHDNKSADASSCRGSTQTSAVEHELLNVLLHFGQLLHQLDGTIVELRARRRRRSLVREAVIQVVACLESRQVRVICWGNCLQHMEHNCFVNLKGITGCGKPVTEDTNKLQTNCLPIETDRVHRAELKAKS